jgi:hypothetical protein
MRRVAGTVVVISTLFAVLDARAQTSGAPPVADYPPPDCQKPELKVIKSETQRSGNSWVTDNSRLIQFDEKAQAFYSCMHGYVDNANNEVKKIQDKANSDLKQISDNANASIKAIQDKVREAVNEANDLALAQTKSAAEAKASR